MKIPKKNALEWAVFAMGAALLCAVVSYLVYDIATTGSRPPDLVATPGRPERTSRGFAVPVSVANNGDVTVEAVTISVALARGDRELERVDVELAFLPRRAQRQLWAHFKTDPSSGSVEASVTGFRAATD